VIPLRPGVRRLLEEARAAGLRLAIATTTTPENVDALLEASLGPGTTVWFEQIGAGDVVPEKKPAPDIYLYVLERMGLASKDCLAFEDSENGVRSATSAGLMTVVTINDYTADHDFNGADLVVDQLGEAGDPATASHGQQVLNGSRYVDLNVLRRLHASR